MNRDRSQRVAELLVDNIRRELVAASHLHALGLDDAVLDRLAEAVAANVLYAFVVDWSPDWIKPGQIHSWESAGEWFTRCPGCLEDSPLAPHRETAISWVAHHMARHSTQHE